ncbi:transcription elongation factor spt5 [Entomophthora muscae]|uniref:Transcription elongation factor spt5 n=1 Tax=Entomophthora muscae TaxID=34485 RepID=A0ACC2S952_9FUNG|nr:transcription elongation factor spt5 [Entomophthora muscae]
MSRRNSHMNRYDEEEEEEDDEEDDYEQDDFVVDDEEDDDYAHASRMKKKQKKTQNIFIDDAAVDSEGEDEDYEDEEEEGFIDYDNEEPATTSRASHYTRQPIMEEEEESAEAIADRFNKKYQAMHDSFRSEAGHRHTAFPSAGDPCLWMMKCKPGKEKDIIVALMRRSLSYRASSQPYPIQTVFFREANKGYIYVESFKATFVQKAVERIPDLYGGNVTLVPRKEMVDVVDIKNKSSDLKMGGWARVKRGKYQGDLCQIIHINDSQDSVRVKNDPPS